MDAEAEVGGGGGTLCSKRCGTIALAVSGGLSGVTDRASSNSHSGTCDGFWLEEIARSGAAEKWVRITAADRITVEI
jgi:hypothetical protein